MTDDALVDLLYKDVTRGIEGTGVCAGVLKASSTLNAISSTADRVFAAVAAVHRQTGIPISTHTEAGTMALEQIARFERHGVALDRVIIGHLDRKLDAAYLKAVAETGVYMGFDQISKTKYAPDEARVSAIKALVEAGHGRQLLLSGDLARRSYWPAYGRLYGPGFAYILQRFIPWLHAEGLPASVLDDLLIHNPARALPVRPARPR